MYLHHLGENLAATAAVANALMNESGEIYFILFFYIS